MAGVLGFRLHNEAHSRERRLKQQIKPSFVLGRFELVPREPGAEVDQLLLLVDDKERPDSQVRVITKSFTKTTRSFRCCLWVLGRAFRLVLTPRAARRVVHVVGRGRPSGKQPASKRSRVAPTKSPPSPLSLLMSTSSMYSSVSARPRLAARPQSSSTLEHDHHATPSLASSSSSSCRPASRPFSPGHPELLSSPTFGKEHTSWVASKAAQRPRASASSATRACLLQTQPIR